MIKKVPMNYWWLNEQTLNTDWNWRKKRPEYWNLEDLRSRTGNGEGRENQGHLIFLVLRFTVVQMRRNAFSVAR